MVCDDASNTEQIAHQRTVLSNLFFVVRTQIRTVQQGSIHILRYPPLGGHNRLGALAHCPSDMSTAFAISRLTRKQAIRSLVLGGYTASCVASCVPVATPILTLIWRASKDVPFVIIADLAAWITSMRIEDDALVTTKGCELMTRGVPVDADEIEGLMRG